LVKNLNNMKKIVLLLLITTVFMSCKNETKTSVETEEVSDKTSKQNDGLLLLQGEFVYYADAAVLQGSNNIMYSVVINDKMHELNDLSKEYKKEATDYVAVEIRGKVTPKPENEEGWPYRIEIKEILKVTESKADDVIKIGSN